MNSSKAAARHLHLVPAVKKSRKVNTDYFRTDAAQDEFRRRYNYAQAKLQAK